MAYKILYLLKKYRREAIQKKIYKKAAAKFLAIRLQKKAMLALGLRVGRNQELRRDLVKRYYIHNSDDEDESADAQPPKTFLNSEGPIQLAPALKDEFFAVTVCSKKQFLRLRDPISNYMFDVMEPDPEYFVVNNRSNIEVQYQDRKVRARDNFELDKLPKHEYALEERKPFVKTEVTNYYK